MTLPAATLPAATLPVTALSAATLPVTALPAAPSGTVPGTAPGYQKVVAAYHDEIDRQQEHGVRPSGDAGHVGQGQSIEDYADDPEYYAQLRAIYGGTTAGAAAG